MKLTNKEAKDILENARNKFEDQRWIDHSLCVGEAAKRIAVALKKNNIEVDVDKAETLGYVHDIGKMTGPSNGHIIRGYEYMKEQGYDEEYCNVCLTHSYLNNDINCTAGGIPDDIPFRTKFIQNHQYTLEEKIINLCDLMCTTKIYTIDKRLIDIMMRRGAYSNTQYHIKETYKLKEYFDDLLGYNLYDLFPEIKDHL